MVSRPHSVLPDKDWIRCTSDQGDQRYQTLSCMILSPQLPEKIGQQQRVNHLFLPLEIRPLEIRLCDLFPDVSLVMTGSEIHVKLIQSGNNQPIQKRPKHQNSPLPNTVRNVSTGTALVLRTLALGRCAPQVRSTVAYYVDTQIK
jgi:hypothetical protein